MGEKEFLLIKNFLESNGFAFRVLIHEAVFTSQDAAKIRGTPLHCGVKAIVLKSSDGNFLLALVSGDKRIDLKKLAKIAGVKKVFLASPIEVLEKTGCEIGSVHPLGNLSGLAVYMDGKILENETVDFNVGLHTTSIEMNSKDLLKATGAMVENYSI